MTTLKTAFLAAALIAGATSLAMAQIIDRNSVINNGNTGIPPTFHPKSPDARQSNSPSLFQDNTGCAMTQSCGNTGGENSGLSNPR